MKYESKEQQKLQILKTTNNFLEVLEKIAKSSSREESFYVMDTSDILKKHDLWLTTFPKIKPFYAVKCNDSPIVLGLLAKLGTGFDCASKAEINKVLSLGIDPSRIIFANPVKPASHIKFAAKVGVDLMTFDNMAELEKIHHIHPNARLILRLRIDAYDAQCPLGLKYGVDPENSLAVVHDLLKVAFKFNLKIVGVSFHVGSGCREPTAYRRAIRSCRNVIEIAKSYGHSPNIIDIGGGFDGNHDLNNNQIADELNTAIKEYLIDEDFLIIAEPGRFYVASAFTLATLIIGKRNDGHIMYYVNDGVYGSFNCVLYDHAAPKPQFFKRYSSDIDICSVWGPTCDSLDMITSSASLPVDLEMGDWLYFRDMGAYTLVAASEFNGFPLPTVYYLVDNQAWKLIQDLPIEAGLTLQKIL